MAAFRALSVLVLVSLASASASAWTEAAARSIRAEVVLADDGSARVALTVEVRVHSGWLEGFELAGFDSDLVLDEEARPFAIDDTGRRFSPRASVHRGGRIALAFRRSPRRGRLMVFLAYRTRLGHRSTEALETSDVIRVRWRMPGWSAGLDGVQIDVTAPPGSVIAPTAREELGANIETDMTEDVDGSTVLRWRRAHLPRTVAWEVAVDVPAARMVPELRGPPVVEAPPAPHSEAPVRVDSTPFWFSVALALALLCCLKPFAVRRLANAAESRAQPLLFAPAMIRLPLALVACGLGAYLGPGVRWIGIACFAAAALLTAYRPARADLPSRLGAWHYADLRWVRAARRAELVQRLHPLTLVDATTPLGALLALGWLCLPLWLTDAPVESDWLWLVAVLPAPILLSGTRSSFPIGPVSALSQLLRLVDRTRAVPNHVALRPTLHMDVHGHVQEARIHLVTPERAEGILRFDLAIAMERHFGGYATEPVLHVVTRAGSAAELALAERLKFVRADESSGGRRIARTVRVGVRDLTAIAVVLDAFKPCPIAVENTRGVAVPAETVRDLPAPSAVAI